MKYIAVIMALFLFTGSLSACGLSDMCCQDSQELTIDCCKKSDDSHSDDDNQDASVCCDQAISYVQKVLQVPTEIKLELQPSTVVILPAIFNLSYDFHNVVWQPPKYS